MRRSTLALALLASTTVAATVAAPAIAGRARRKEAGPVTAGDTWRARISNHATFTHDSLDSLGYDWGRIADPAVKPHYPLKVYLPRTTDDVVRIVNEAKVLGERLTIRSKGHSSNDLVVADRGSVLVVEKLNAILGLDEEALTVTVQAGAAMADIDDWLAPRGYGLPVIGSHKDITAGGFASVGGFSAASHRYGMFADTVERLEYVNWDGEVLACSRAERPDHFYRVLTGTGRHGVIVTLTCRILRLDKYGTIVEAEQPYYRDVERFIAGSSRYFAEPGDRVLMERGVWLDAGRLKAGQFSAYRPTAQTAYKRLRNRIGYGYLHGIGYFAGRLPATADRLLKYVGMAATFFGPRYGSFKNVDFFTDKTLDYTVGDPTRMLAILMPVERYAELFRATYRLMLDYRERHGCFSFIAIYVKGIRSEYLARGDRGQRFGELTYYLGIKPQRMTGAILDDLVSQLDDLCIAHGAFRYMHTRTVKDPARRRRIDPNAFYAEATSPVAIPAD